MSYEAFDVEPCVFFVGGNDYKVNNDNAGKEFYEASGCTKGWWDTELGGLTIDDGQDYIDAATAAMGKLMNADGSPTFFGLMEVNAWNFDDDWVKFKIDGSGDFPDNVEVGMLLYVDDDQFVLADGSGYYKIIEMQGHEWIKISARPNDPESGTERVYGVIGGAFKDVGTIASRINCAYFSNQILVNKDYTITSSIDVNDWGFGDAARSTWLCIHGFNRVPDDIVNPAGAFYQGIKQAFDDTVAGEHNFVSYGSDSLGDNLFDMADVENIIFEGFNFHGVGSASYYHFSALAESVNHVFKHCVFKKAALGRAAFSYLLSHRLIIEDCCFINFTNYRSILANNGTTFLRNCIFQGSGVMTVACINETVIVSNVVSIGGSRFVNISTVGGQIFAMDSTFTGSAYCDFFLGGGGDGKSVFCGLFGNIHKLIAVDNNWVIIMRDDNYPTSTYMSNCNAWSDAGKLDALVFNTKSNPEDLFVRDVIEVDPALDGDLHPTNKTLREYGPFGQWKWLGAIQVTPDLPDVANVTEDDTVDDEPGTFAVPAVADVESGVQFGEGGTELTGTFLPPSTPTFTLAEGDGQVTATIAGDAGVDHYLLYKKPSDTAWQAGGNRNGDGDITATGLSDGVPYIFVVYSFLNSVPSVPAIAQLVTLAGDTDDEASIDGAMSAGYAQLIEHMGVMVTYRPAGGGSRPIKAIVHQKQPSALGGAQGATSTHTTVMVLNDATVGISSAEVDTGGDKIEIATRIGKAAQARRIVAPILFHNASVMKVRVS